jgi:hypothetical protein
MKRVGIALAIGLAAQAAVWFLVPDGKFGPCGPIDDAAVFKLMLLMPGIVVGEWFHVGQGKIGMGLLFLTPTLIYAAISWIVIAVVMRFRGSKVV